MSENQPRPTARLYTRVSTHRQLRDGTSVPAQISQGVAYAEYRKLDLGPPGTISVGEYPFEAPQRVYIDSASAFKTPLLDRPEGRRLHKDLQRGDHVLITKLDRGFRSTEDCLRTARLFEDMGVTMHLLDLQLDAGTAFGKFGITVMAAVAELESRRRGERVAEAYWEKVHLTGVRGKKMEVARPGFVWVGKGRGKKIVPVMEEQVTMWAIWRLICDGWGELRIKWALDRSGIRLPEAILKSSKRFTEHTYSQRRVGQIVEIMRHHQERIEGKEESVRLYEHLSRVLKTRQKNGPGNEPRPLENAT